MKTMGNLLILRKLNITLFVVPFLNQRYTAMVAIAGVLVGFLLWIPLVLVSIPLFIPVLVFGMYKFIVAGFLVKIFRRDLLERVVEPEFGFSADNFNSPKSAICFMHILNGYLNKEILIKKLQDTIYMKRYNDRDLNYERLHSKIFVSWMGYPFWTKIQKTDFNISDHVKLVKSADKLDREGIDGIFEEYMKSAFRERKPLWDVLVYEGISAETGESLSLFGFRIHHMIGDGYSMLEFLHLLFDEPIQNRLPHKRVPQSLSESLRCLFWTPAGVFRNISSYSIHSDIFSTIKPNQKLAVTRMSFDLTDLKKIRGNLSTKYKVQIPFITIFLFIFGGALRQALKKDCEKHNSLNLGKINVACSLPRPNRPHQGGSFQNHWASVVYSVPLEPENRATRLLKMIENVTDISETKTLEISLKFSRLLTVLPRPLCVLIMENSKATTIGLGNLPGPSSPSHLCGIEIVEKYALIGLLLQNASFTLGTFSYNGRLYLGIVSNQSTFSKLVRQKLLEQCIKEEIQKVLAESCCDENV